MPKSKLYDFDTYPVNNNQTTAPQVTNNSPLNVVGKIGASAVPSTNYSGTNLNYWSVNGRKTFETPKSPYLPTDNATSNAYLDIANNPLSAPFANGNFQYSALTKGGTSYIPVTNPEKAKDKPDTPPTYTYTPVSVGGGYGSGTVNRQANFQASEAYNQAMNYTNQLLAQLNSGKTSYTDQINMLMDSINNRASFAYDPDTDPLFQQYLASSMESGKTAMQDTMAQASALTGGYGSSYATAAANGAYNNFVQDAYNNLPEYYQTALDAYNSETNNLYNKLNMYNVADATEYGRLANAYQNNYAMANDMYGKEYSNYWDALNYDTSIDQYNADQAYKYASLAQDNAQFNAKMAYQAQQDNIAQKNYVNELAQQTAEAQQEAEMGRTPTQAELMKALDIYNKPESEGGGYKGVETYLDSFNEPLNVEIIGDFIENNKTRKSEANKYAIKAFVANGK